MLGFGAPGPIELFLIAAICLGPVLLVIFVVRSVTKNSRGGSPPGTVECPGCGVAVAPGDSCCRECGCPLSGPPPQV